MIDKRKAEADAGPPANAPAAVLAQFYYDRGAARAYLGRNQDALADGLQALASAGGSADFSLRSRLLQFVGLRYTAVGDFKRAMDTFSTIVREAEADQKRGAEIDALANNRDWRSRSAILPRATRSPAASRRWFRKRAAAQIRNGAPPTRSTAQPSKPTPTARSAFVLESQGRYARRRGRLSPLRRRSVARR